ncbi:MAG: GGDEF domain-containing protein [Halanaerobiales bacterium]
MLFNLFFISSYKERGVFSSSGIRRISFIIIQFYFFYLLGNRTDIHNELLDLLLQVNRSIFLLSVLLFLLSLINIVKNFKSNEDYAFLFVLINIFVLFFNLQANYQLLTLVFTLLILLVFIFAILKDFYAMAYLDELTGLPGRRALREEVLKLGDYYSIAMLDIDYFKKFNDKFGHDVGDQALKMVASMIDRVKGGAKAYRYGGEEFTILFPGKSSKEAYPFLEELRESIASRPFIIRNNKRDKKKAGKNIKSGEEVRITVSIGLAEKTNKEKNPLEVIKKADQELYKAKRKGRNCVKL